MGAPIQDAADARRFAMAGRARVTVVSDKTGKRFTYSVRRKEDAETDLWFVGVLAGPNNDADYSYLGIIRKDGKFFHGRNAKVGRDAPTAKAWAWCWRRLTAGQLEGFEVWHEGSCGKCGRALTVPESLATGLGPICASRAHHAERVVQRAG